MTETENAEKNRKIETLLTMQPSINQNHHANHDEIASIAFLLWDQAGRPSGRDLEFWLSAEQRVIAMRQSQADASVPSQSSPKSSSFSRMDFSTDPTATAVRSSLTGTNRSGPKNGSNPTAKQADRPAPARAKKTTSNVTQ